MAARTFNNLIFMIEDYWNNYIKPISIPVSILVLVLIAGIICGAWLFGTENSLISNAPLIAYGNNIFSDMLTMIVTIAALNWLSERRMTKHLRLHFQAQVQSKNNLTALDAINELQLRDWLNRTDSPLNNIEAHNANWSGATLWNANLRNAQIQDADLQNVTFHESDLQWAKLDKSNLASAHLNGANLQFASLQQANLQQAMVSKANLQWARLGNANLQRAWMEGANLQWTSLQGANLRGANLYGANLQDAVLSWRNLALGTTVKAEFDENTTLPDGQKYDPEKGLEQLAQFGAIVKPWTEEQFAKRKQAWEQINQD